MCFSYKMSLEERFGMLGLIVSLQSKQGLSLDREGIYGWVNETLRQ